MTIAERQSGDITILDVSGKIVFGQGDEDFREAITRLIDSGRVKLIINMAEVPFVDSEGIGQLVRTFVTAGKRGGQMKLLNLTRRVEELLTMTRLLTVFEVFDEEADAVASFGPK